MSDQRASDFLKRFTRDLKDRGAFPRNLRLASIGPVSIASVYDEEPCEIISERVFSGMDHAPEVAILKGLVEYVETRAFHSGARRRLESCLTERSDGFAAFPVGAGVDAGARARRNAYHEALERYVWSRWWDEADVSHDIADEPAEKESATGVLLSELAKLLPIQSTLRILPRYMGAESGQVVLLFSFLEPFGVISGGACDVDSEVAAFRAACELVRHGIALARMEETPPPRESFYERRLRYFGSTSEGEERVQSRLAADGRSILKVPSLVIDEVVGHDLSDLVRVHRCLFDGQPTFMGGDLERLCL